jgi:SSS family solute:Na+ symporter
MIIPVIVKSLMPVGVVSIFLGAILAAVMSTGASCLLALSSMMFQNVLKRVFFPNSSDKTMVMVTRATVIVMCVLVTIIALKFPYAYILCVFAFDLTLSTLFIPLVLGFFWKGANNVGATCGIVGGAATRIVGAGLLNGFSLEGVTASSDNWYVFTLLGPVVSLVCMVGGSLLSQKQDPPKRLAHGAC